MITSREMDVIRLLAKGMSVKEMATHLGLSTKTVGTHCYRIRRKCYRPGSPRQYPITTLRLLTTMLRKGVLTMDDLPDEFE